MEERDTDKLLEMMNFESREAYDRAKKEADFIRKAKSTMDITDGKTALKLYNKIVTEKLFSSFLGYEFLLELRENILFSKVVSASALPDIPVREIIKTENDTLEEKSYEIEKYRQLYEGQKVLDKKYKIALVVCVLILVGFIIVNFRLEYSVFTYFTNYKANMEEELINKYEAWEEELEERERALSGETDEYGDEETTVTE